MPTRTCFQGSACAFACIAWHSNASECPKRASPEASYLLLGDITQMSLLVNRNRFGIGLIDTTKSAFYGWGVKGATQAHLPPRTRSGHFNPRAREGRDACATRCPRRRRSFNPRAREGRDKSSTAPASTSPCFNPRAREGRDDAESRKAVLPHVSIHAPVKGATSSARSGPWSRTRFNPRARKGRDRA